MTPHPIDRAQLNFDPGTLLALNVILGLIMFGVNLYAELMRRSQEDEFSR